jgi:hypothetical protein
MAGIIAFHEFRVVKFFFSYFAFISAKNFTFSLAFNFMNNVIKYKRAFIFDYK